MRKRFELRMTVSIQHQHSAFLVPEMPPAREHHRQALLVGGGDHFGVAHRAAGLHDGGRAGGGDRVEAIAERKERVRRGDGSGQRAGRAFITATLTASTRLICPAPTASVRSAPVKITAFDFTCAQTRHANRSAIHSSAVGCALRHDLRKVVERPRLRAPRSPVAILHQHAAQKRPRLPRRQSPASGSELREISGRRHACSAFVAEHRPAPRPRSTAR